jgi:NADPH-dependent ferric siderophore reductase
MSDRPAGGPDRGRDRERGNAAPHRARVKRVEQLTPHMVRVVLSGDGLALFATRGLTDHYIKMLFPVPGVAHPDPFDVQTIRAEFPREQWPRTRTYTVRSWDPESGELSVDFVLHGDEGVAGPWAARAEPGDEIAFMGPGGDYAPDAHADWHLLAGDESALPAIAAALEQLPAGARAHAFIEVDSPLEEQKLASPGEAEITWLHRGGRRVGDALVQAVTEFEFPGGTPQAFVHGEAGFVKELRRLLLLERAVPRDRLSISGYWRAGHDEDGWQASKRDWNRQVEQEQAGPSGG